MLCTPYRCSQEKKNIRRQLCNWSTKTLALVGLEEVLATAYGGDARDKLPYNEASEVLSKTVNLIENDSNVCGVCGKPKKAPVRRFLIPKALYQTNSEALDMSKLGQSSLGDQPIDLSMGSRFFNCASPTAFANELSMYSTIPNTPSSSLNLPNGSAVSQNRVSPPKRQRIVRLPTQKEVLQMVGDTGNLDPESIQQLASTLVNNWAKAQSLQQKNNLNSPDRSPKPNKSPNINDVPGPSTLPSAPRPTSRPSMTLHRPLHHRTSTGDTVNHGDNLSEQDQINRFKQWRIASWVQEASRHQREGSALAHHEDPVDIRSSLPSSRNSLRPSGTSNVRSSPQPPPLSTVIGNVASNDTEVSKSTAQKRLAQVPQQQAKKRASPTPLPQTSQGVHQPQQQGSVATSSALKTAQPHSRHQLKPTPSSGTVDASAAKRIRSDAPPVPVSNSSTPGQTNNNAASLNNLASVLSALIPSSSQQQPASTAASALNSSSVSSNDLDTLIAYLLGSAGSSQQQQQQQTHRQQQQSNDPTAALLAAAYQQQMQAAALLQLQYASVFNNPLSYSNLLLGGAGSGNSLTNSAPSTSVPNSSSNSDALVTEALLAMLSGNNASTQVNSSTVQTLLSALSASDSNKRAAKPQEAPRNHLQGNTSTSLNVTPLANRHTTSSSQSRQAHTRTSSQRAGVEDKSSHCKPSEPTTQATAQNKHSLENKRTPAEPVISSSCKESSSRKATTPQLHQGPTTRQTAASLQRSGNGVDLSVRSSPVKKEEPVTAAVTTPVVVAHNGNDDGNAKLSPEPPLGLEKSLDSVESVNGSFDRKASIFAEASGVNAEENAAITTTSNLFDVSSTPDHDISARLTPPPLVSSAAKALVAAVDNELSQSARVSSLSRQSSDNSSGGGANHRNHDDSRDSHIINDCNSSSPVPTTSRNGNAAEIIDLQTV